MITSFILNGVFGLIYFALSPIRALPTATLPDFVNAALSSIPAYLSLLYQLLPLTTVALISCIGFIVVYEGAYFSYKAIKWLYTKIPGIS